MTVTRPWFKFLRPEHVRLMEALRPIVGGSTMDQVLDLYQEARLVEAVDGDWRIWGDMDEDGTSRGPIPHSAVVAAAQVCLQEKLGLRKAVLLATVGLAHDAHKRQDMESRGDYDASHARSRARLATLFGDDIAKLAELSGHGAMPTVLKRLGDLLTAVVFSVDNMVVGTKIVPAAEKCDMLDAAAMTGRYPYNDEGLALYGVPYFTMQRYIAASLEARIATLLNVSPTNRLADHLRGWVVEDFGVTL